MSMNVIGLGTAVPEFSLTQSESYEATHQLCCETEEQRKLMEQIYLRAGVQSRGSVVLSSAAGAYTDRTDFFKPRVDDDDRGPTTGERMEKYEEHALSLALESCRQAFQESEIDVSEITHLVTVSCSGFQAPGFDIGLIQDLGLSPDTSRTHVGFMGCHGSFNGLRVAKGYTDSDPEARVLLCSVELCTLHHHYGWSTEKVIANGLFADGSGAVICRNSASDAKRVAPAYRLIRNGSHLLANSIGAMSWTIGDHGFEMTLSQKVPELIERHLRPWLEGFLAKDGLSVSDVKGWAIHPGGPRILDACGNALSLTADDLAPAREVLARHGNMSSSTVLFVLEQLRQEPMEGPVVALGFGPGLTIEAMLLHRNG